MKKTTKKNDKLQTIKCVVCGTEENFSSTKPPRKFYKCLHFKGANIQFESLGYYTYCKPCLKEMTCNKTTGKIDVDRFKEVLKLMNRPFFKEKYISALQNDDDTLGTYLRIIGLKGFSDMTWENGETSDNTTSKSINNIINNTSSELINKWGSSYNSEEIEKLELFWNDMKRSYNIEGASHHDYLKKICKISLKMEEAIDGGNIDEFKKLSEVYDKLMHSSKFTAVQRSAADRTGGLNTFSEFFEYIEKEGFIPKFHTEEPVDIVDRTIEDLKEYTKRLVLGETNLNALIDESIKKIAERGLEEEIELDSEDDLYDETIIIEDDYEDNESGDV